METIPAVKAVMTAFPKPVEAAAGLAEARALMQELGVHHLPVKRGAELIGVLSDRHLRAALARRRSEVTVDPRVGEVMDAHPYVVDLDTPLDVVLLTLADRHLDCALVTKEGRLAGIFTTTDACRAFGRHLRKLRPSGGDDAA
jgi:acetoin utilization protein AcuB